MRVNITKKHLRRYGLPVLILLAALGAALYLLLRPGAIWVNGYKISDLEDTNHYLILGGGRATYDHLTRTLYLEDANISTSHRGAGIYSTGGLTICLQGSSTASGEQYGIRAGGSLRIMGNGSLDVWGGKNGIRARSASVEGTADLSTRGGETALYEKTGLSISQLHRLAQVEEDGSFHTTAAFEGQRWLRAISPVTVRLNGNGGESPEPLYVPWGEAYPEVPDGVREGYYFDGWFTDRGHRNLFDFSGTAQEDLELYAGWTKIVYITFDSWGGSPVETIDLAIHTAAQPPADPEKVDQNFIGWYADDDLTVPYDFSLPVEEDLELYAKWEKVCDEVAYGVDVSSWQRDINWKNAAKDGVQFALLRAGFRGYGAEGTLNADDYFEKNLEGALAAGLDVGCYFYCQSTSEEEAVEEAEFLLDLIGGRELTLPVFLDFEVPVDANGAEIGRLAEQELSGEEHARICLAFCRRIEEAGYTAMVYAGKGHLSQDNMAGILDEAGYGVWLAHWRIQTNYPGKYVFWQYSAKGSVKGIQGDVDMDVRYIVTPAQVEGLKVSPGGGGLALSWARVPGCYAYIVYRESADGQTKEVARLRGAGTTRWQETEDLPVGEYSYFVAAYLTQNGEEYVGERSEPVTVEVSEVE